MRQTEITPIEMKVLMNHIYELQKGVRQMVLFTCPKQYEAYATKRLCSQNMDFVLQPAGKNNLNFYIGRKECLNAIRLIVTRVNAIVKERLRVKVDAINASMRNNTL